MIAPDRSQGEWESTATFGDLSGAINRAPPGVGDDRIILFMSIIGPLQGEGMARAFLVKGQIAFG